jgi:hypothetical protein
MGDALFLIATTPGDNIRRVHQKTLRMRSTADMRVNVFGSGAVCTGHTAVRTRAPSNPNVPLMP